MCGADQPRSGTYNDAGMQAHGSGRLGGRVTSVCNCKWDCVVSPYLLSMFTMPAQQIVSFPPLPTVLPILERVVVVVVVVVGSVCNTYHKYCEEGNPV